MKTRIDVRWTAAAVLTLLSVACAARGPVPTETPTPAPAPAPSAGAETPSAAGPVRGKLPAIARSAGPIDLSLVYPDEGQTMGTRDSTFVYGSTGTADAALRINGRSVEVSPNGAFLGFLPIPASGVYTVTATSPSGDTATVVRHVRVPTAPAPPPDSGAVIADGSVTPSGAMSVESGERVEVAFRGTPGGVASLVLPDSTRLPLVEESVESAAPEGLRNFGVNPDAQLGARRQSWARYRGFLTARPLASPDTATPWPSLIGGILPSPVPGFAHVELVAGGDTARAPLRLNLALMPESRPRVGVATLPGPRPQSPGHVRAEWTPNGTWSLFWPPGTRMTLTGQRGSEYRVSLAPGLDAWLDSAQVRLLPKGTPPVSGSVGTVRLTASDRAVEVRLATSDRFPFRVEASEDALTLTIWGAGGDTGWLQYGHLDPWVRQASWRQEADGVYRLRLDLGTWPWGWKTRWAANGDLVLTVRKPPVVAPDAPLKGLTIAIDAGHPPGGTVSGTGFTEAQANLAEAEALKPLLEKAGARVLMTRSGPGPVGLYERTDTAEKAGADLLISMHNNAFPDGVDPWENSGTSAYYFHAPSALLAQDLERELVEELGLRNLGVGRSSLALVRNPTWMPAVLTETMFMLIPIQGAALENPDVQKRIAEAHLRGIEAFVRARGR